MYDICLDNFTYQNMSTTSRPATRSQVTPSLFFSVHIFLTSPHVIPRPRTPDEKTALYELPIFCLSIYGHTHEPFNDRSVLSLKSVMSCNRKLPIRIHPHHHFFALWAMPCLVFSRIWKNSNNISGKATLYALFLSLPIGYKFIRTITALCISFYCALFHFISTI